MFRCARRPFACLFVFSVIMYQGRGCENREGLLVVWGRAGMGVGSMRDIFTWGNIVRILCAAFEVSCKRVNAWKAREEREVG